MPISELAHFLSLSDEVLLHRITMHIEDPSGLVPAQSAAERYDLASSLIFAHTHIEELDLHRMLLALENQRIIPADYSRAFEDIHYIHQFATTHPEPHFTLMFLPWFIRKKLSLQDIFDAAWKHYIINEAPPACTYNDRGNYTCRYLDPVGNRCAIGLSLPRSILSMEGGFSRLAMEYPQLFTEDVLRFTEDPEEDGGGPMSLDIFQEMLHDAHLDTLTGEWKNTLEVRRYKYYQAAKRYGLRIPGE